MKSVHSSYNNLCTCSLFLLQGFIISIMPFKACPSARSCVKMTARKCPIGTQTLRKQRREDQG